MHLSNLHITRLCIVIAILVLGFANSENVAQACSLYKAQIQQYLSPGSTIQCGLEGEVRWSEYAAPQPAATVTVGSEDDVSRIVTFASRYNLKFLVQSGGNGWADTFDLGANGIVIDVSKLTAIQFNNEKTEVTIQAGVLIADLVKAAWEADARVATGTCNCVSVLGAALGGGVGRTQGLYGQGADQLLSVNYVNGDGHKATVTPESDPDLWWALTGAGANFGIVVSNSLLDFCSSDSFYLCAAHVSQLNTVERNSVSPENALVESLLTEDLKTSVVFASYPIPQANNNAWTGVLTFDPSQIEAVIEAINNLTLEPEMEIDFYFTGGQVLALPFYVGDEEDGRQKFKSILDIGPLTDQTEVIPYNTWNAAGDAFCIDGGRKPAYATNLKTMDPVAWRSIWNDYSSFIAAHPEANLTTILAECYSTSKSLELGSLGRSSYPWRDIKCYGIAIPWYTDSSLDEEGNKLGQAARSHWTPSSGTPTFSA
ncbi:MAG: hypothetical protein Q9160_007296 [Pyrenula sp. 1 TL-2023]